MDIFDKCNKSTLSQKIINFLIKKTQTISLSLYEGIYDFNLLLLHLFCEHNYNAAKYKCNY